MLLSRGDLSGVVNVSTRANADPPFDPLTVWVHYEWLYCFMKNRAHKARAPSCRMDRDALKWRTRYSARVRARALWMYCTGTQTRFKQIDLFLSALSILTGHMRVLYNHLSEWVNTCIYCREKKLRHARLGHDCNDATMRDVPAFPIINVRKSRHSFVLCPRLSRDLNMQLHLHVCMLSITADFVFTVCAQFKRVWLHACGDESVHAVASSKVHIPADVGGHFFYAIQMQTLLKCKCNAYKCL